MRDERGLGFDIEIDGGITMDNVGEVVRAGVNWVVAGNSVFRAPNPAEAVAGMKQAALDSLAQLA
jgi:ribulose-phosphate 3-epimerase